MRQWDASAPVVSLEDTHGKACLDALPCYNDIHEEGWLGGHWSFNALAVCFKLKGPRQSANILLCSSPGNFELLIMVATHIVDYLLLLPDSRNEGMLGEASGDLIFTPELKPEA